MFHPKGPTLLELTKQALSSTTKGYDLLAEKFEYTPFRTPDILLEPLVAVAQREPIGTALDLCCGNGAIARAIRPIVTERIVGLDLSEGMLVDARARLRETPGECPVDFVQGDAFELVDVDVYDLIATAGAFGHILEHQQHDFVQRVYRALKPGGRFVFLTSLKPPKSNPAWWMARGFNAVMHVRNAVLDPPFIMFYLTFPLERACDVLWKEGFDVTVDAPFDEPRMELFRVVTATKPTSEN